MNKVADAKFLHYIPSEPFCRLRCSQEGGPRSFMALLNDPIALARVSEYEATFEILKLYVGKLKRAAVTTAFSGAQRQFDLAL